MFTYKKHIPVGRYRSFEEEQHDIKLKKKVVGHIAEAGHFSGKTGFGISLAVKKEATKEEPASFRWANLKARFNNADEAKAFLEKNFDAIIKQYDLHSFED